VALRRLSTYTPDAREESDRRLIGDTPAASATLALAHSTTSFSDRALEDIEERKLMMWNRMSCQVRARTSLMMPSCRSCEQVGR
jgi:hypothetical protein